MCDLCNRRIWPDDEEGRCGWSTGDSGAVFPPTEAGAEAEREPGGGLAIVIGVPGSLSSRVVCSLTSPSTGGGVDISS